MTRVVSGHAGADTTLRVATADGAAEAELCRRLGDVTVTRVDTDAEAPHAPVRIWKGASSSFDIYYAVRPGGDVLVGDHFRNVVSFLPVAERQLSDARVDALPI